MTTPAPTVLEPHAPAAAATHAARRESRPRMLFVAPQPVVENRGTPIAVAHVLRALSELGWRVDLLTLPVGEDIELPGLEILRVGRWLRFRSVAIGLSFSKVVLDLLLSAAMARRLRRHDYACIHAVEEMAFPAAVLGRAAGVPVVYDMHSSLPEQLAKHRPLAGATVQDLLRRLERNLVRRVASVVCSAGLEAIVEAADPRKSCEPWRFPGHAGMRVPGDAAKLRAELDLPKDAPVVVYCGSFEAYQGLRSLVLAMAELRSARSDAVLVLVGASRSEDFELAHGTPLAGTDAVRILPRRPRHEIDRFLAMADIVVSTRSHGRNAPLKLFDYMAAARPIVAVDCAAHRAVLDDSSALLVEHRPSAIAGAIGRLLNEPALARQLARRAGERARQEFGWRAFVEQVARVHAPFVATRARQPDAARVRASLGARP